MSDQQDRLDEILESLKDEVSSASNNMDWFYGDKVFREAKAQILAWHKEEVEKALPNERPRQGYEDKPESTWKDFGYEQAVKQLEASLEAE